MQRWWYYSYFQFADEDPSAPERVIMCQSHTASRWQNQYSHPVVLAPESLFLTLFRILVRRVKTKLRVRLKVKASHYPWRRRKERGGTAEGLEGAPNLLPFGFVCLFSRRSEQIWPYLFPRADKVP